MTINFPTFSDGRSCSFFLVDENFRVVASSEVSLSNVEDSLIVNIGDVVPAAVAEQIRLFAQSDRDQTRLSVPAGLTGSIEVEVLRLHTDEIRYAVLVAEMGSIARVFAGAPVGLFALDEAARFLEVNQKTLQILERAEEEVLGQPLTDFLAPGYLRRHSAVVRRLARTGELEEADYTFLTPRGELRETVISANAELGRDGRINRLIGSMVDVTERREIERTYRQIDQKYKLLFERNLAGVFRCTIEDGKVFECNDAFARILGYRDRVELLESGVEEIYVDSEEQRSLYRKLRKRRSLFGIELALKKRDGEPIWTLQNLSLIPSEHSEPVVEGTLFDITERRLAQEKVRYQSLHDPLTGLPNPRLFDSCVEEKLRNAAGRNEFVTLLFVDLDGFKVVNDTMGHAVGNELLQLVAMRLRKALRSEDIVSRLGGDEFTIAGTVSKLEGAESLARKVLRRMSQPFLLREQNIHVSASVGIAVAPENGQSPEDLLKAADIAMYQAKEAGRNQYVVSSSLSTTVAVSRMELEADLHSAIDNEELELYYQPQVFAETGEVAGLEALIRWDHPERGLLLPDEFIPLAERSGLILSIGTWVLEKGIAQLKRWERSGTPTRLSINISPRQFHSETFASELAAILERHEANPSLLELELTEGLAMENPEATLHTLAELKKMGIRISIDDFGTGYSSLSYLTRFPVDTIKIDRIFIEELSEDDSGSAVISAVIALARELDLDVVAEGVETTAQSEFLRSEECGKLQGFLYGRPGPESEITELLRSQRVHSTS